MDSSNWPVTPPLNCIGVNAEVVAPYRLIEVVDQQRAAIELSLAIDCQQAGSDAGAVVQDTDHDGRAGILAVCAGHFEGAKRIVTTSDKHTGNVVEETGNAGSVQAEAARQVSDTVEERGTAALAVAAVDGHRTRKARITIALRVAAVPKYPVRLSQTT
jgi:hypothetical protein